MPELSTIHGATKSMTKIRDYLEGADGKRTLALDLLNLECEFEGRDWAEEMTRTRIELGTQEDVNGRHARTFMHYVISPDPRDSYDLDALRDLALTWAHENFPDHQVAICYHDDNESRILHAHIVVNNVNLVTHRRISGELTRKRVAGINNSLQNLALERGFSAFTADHVSMNEREMADRGVNVSTRGDERSRARWRDHAPQKKGFAAQVTPLRRSNGYSGRRLGKAERALRADEEPLWKDELAAIVDVAARMTRSERELAGALRLMGASMRESKSGDWIFVHPEGGAKACRGSRLGPAYRRSEIERRWRTSSAMAAGNPARKAAMKALTPEKRREIVRSVRVVGYVRGDIAVSARAVARLLEYNERHCVRGYSDYESTPQGRSMRELARRLHLFAYSSNARRSDDARGSVATGGSAGVAPFRDAVSGRRRRAGVDFPDTFEEPRGGAPTPREDQQRQGRGR